MPLTIAYSACSDVGLRRTRNEDRYCTDTTLGLFIVCDGMGGSKAGEIASGLAIETIHRHINEASLDPTLPLIGQSDPLVSRSGNRLLSAVREANRIIHREGNRNRDWVGMGTTVVAVLLADRLMSFAHVGDSRLYLVRAHAIHPLTADHSWVAEQVRAGLMTEAEAERSPQRNIVTRALGIAPDVKVDIDEAELQIGDRLLLCSDGLTKYVGPARLLDALTQTDDMNGAARQLVALANNAGGDDNTTVIAMAVHETMEQPI
ncbi:MAG: Stp1/IreP family PP2C-type Ser/Thr phosphatase [Nitrospira sp.]|nr:Stp1/IreP family PP2C-type Ser/Thr phosphatase [Nitrospira sp.]